MPLESRFDADAGREACAFGCVDVGTLPCFLVCVHFVDFFFCRSVAFCPQRHLKATTLLASRVPRTSWRAEMKVSEASDRA